MADTSNRFLGSYNSKQMFKNKNSSFDPDENKGQTLEYKQSYETLEHLKPDHRSLEAITTRTNKNFYKRSLKPLPVHIVSTTPDSTSSK